MANDGRILIYFDELVMSLTKAYGSTMDTHIYSPRDILSCMQGIHPVDAVEVVHGYNLDEDTPSLFECSICHWCCGDTYYGDTADYNYCPNCGAKMDRRLNDE